MKIFVVKVNLSNSPIFVNSSWGITSQVLQSILLSSFFILVARYYTTTTFAYFIIATVLYQLLAAFSSLGLSQWFIRELTGSENKKDLVNKYFKIQLYSGIIFYLINIALSFLLYNDKHIHILTILLGINIIFDNLINAIKCINVSEFKQIKSFIILSIDAFLKFFTTCLLFLYPFSIVTLSIFLIIIRFVTLNIFLNLGSSKILNLNILLRYKISLKYLKEIILLNWPFIIIGSVSIINWRTSSIIISKALSTIDVANYEISYRIFSIAQMLPIVVSTTVFPILIKYYKENKLIELGTFYKKVHSYYLLFGLLAFTFIYSFIDFLLPVLFGIKYAGTGIYTKQMFLTILVFPTVYLQANVLVAMKYEKMDMWFNVVSLIINVSLCIVGLFFIRSLAVINISIFIGFAVFHIMQDVVLFRKSIISKKQIFYFYAISIFICSSYILLEKLIISFVLFIIYWPAIIGFYLIINKYRKSNYRIFLLPDN